MNAFGSGDILGWIDFQWVRCDFMVVFNLILDKKMNKIHEEEIIRVQHLCLLRNTYLKKNICLSFQLHFGV